MRRKILLMLCAVMLTLGLSACGTDPKDKDYNGYSYEELENNSNSIWAALLSMDQAGMDEYVSYVDAMSEREKKDFMEQGAEQSSIDPDVQYKLIKNWSSIRPQVGEYKEVESFTISESGKTTTAELRIGFTERPVVLTYVYKNLDMSTEDITVDLVYSVGEKMGKAGLNTVMGMGTVFIMLIIISMIISLFGFIPKLEAKRKQKNQPAEAPKNIQAEAPQPVLSQTREDNELELIAVIAAAIAAGTGQSTDDFVVRSIKRR